MCPFNTNVLFWYETKYGTEPSLEVTSTTLVIFFFRNLELWTLNYDADLRTWPISGTKMNQLAEHLGQLSFYSKVISKHSDRHTANRLLYRDHYGGLQQKRARLVDYCFHVQSIHPSTTKFCTKLVEYILNILSLVYCTGQIAKQGGTTFGYWSLHRRSLIINGPDV